MSLFTLQNNIFFDSINIFLKKKSLLLYLQTRVEHITQKPRIKTRIIITNTQKKIHIPKYIIFLSFFLGIEQETKKNHGTIKYKTS
jgi:hypothetical protein